MNILIYALTNVLREKEVKIVFDESELDIKTLIENEYLIKLEEIKTVLATERLSDFDCIEEISCIFESMGIDIGNRHDF